MEERHLRESVLTRPVLRDNNIDIIEALVEIEEIHLRKSVLTRLDVRGSDRYNRSIS